MENPPDNESLKWAERFWNSFVNEIQDDHAHHQWNNLLREVQLCMAKALEETAHERLRVAERQSSKWKSNASLYSDDTTRNSISADIPKNEAITV